MKIALVHDWITGLRGGERCLLEFVKLFPEADIVTLLHIVNSTHPDIDARVTQTSFLQRIPWARRNYRKLLPLFPFAVRSLNLNKYDVVISLSHSVAKNVKVKSSTFHISYCFTPIRYIWDHVETYLGYMRFPLWPFISAMRLWDRYYAKKLNQIIGISKYVSERIKRNYDLNATTVYPPVDISWIKPREMEDSGEAFLYAGALVPYKNVDIAIAVCEKLGLELWIVGDGPDRERLKSLSSKYVKFLGRVSDEELARYYMRCRALVFPAIEDFGMIPIECMAAGRPVIAASEGGAAETVIGVRAWKGEVVDTNRHTGIFFDASAPNKKDALEVAMRHFLEFEESFSSLTCRERGQEFGVERFRNELGYALKSYQPELAAMVLERAVNVKGEQSSSLSFERRKVC